MALTFMGAVRELLGTRQFIQLHIDAGTIRFTDFHVLAPGAFIALDV